MSGTRISGARIVAPDRVHENAVLTIDGGFIHEISTDGAGSSGSLDLEGGYLVPGFIDTQVNGGGGMLFNDAPTVETIAAIADAHRRFGTTGLLPTLISDDLAKMQCAIEAVDAAIAAGVPGILGIHIEGPFIHSKRRGIHSERFVRAPTDDELELLSRESEAVRLVTLAPEMVPAGTIARLRKAGLLVAAGHSTADYAATRRALEEGLDGFTHLFNAMTPFGSREPGMVGAALEDRTSQFGIIVDGHHVHPASLRVALAARGLEGAMLVTDAMPPAGTDMARFDLQGRAIAVDEGSLRGADGTLAGSALTMDVAFRNAIDMLGLSLSDASRLASANPAGFLRMEALRGAIAPGMAADLVHLDDTLRVRRVWIGGRLFDYSRR
ncbi:N-acetylglucosamine-6-phosphate deacetylase [Erythrobacter sp. LQ02-29]|uniref:N-acetylglucosamine-6-phosphate deacetylase n=1 Tax=Erythrobacter sp. LQ02-29 TaxID=2920384 RepID=UPI001F4EE1FB|nr:N-acetylglucosamine-6-phosphate deacetylase [Erythrobacter sp. LQ02-29]MCP9223698.1 N-acetylglucosamine-6-phosphate deacetylase [Erythrobacter sp. LQ02-29]